MFMSWSMTLKESGWWCVLENASQCFSMESVDIVHLQHIFINKWADLYDWYTDFLHFWCSEVCQCGIWVVDFLYQTIVLVYYNSGAVIFGCCHAGNLEMEVKKPTSISRLTFFETRFKLLSAHSGSTSTFLPTSTFPVGFIFSSLLSPVN